MVMGHVMYVVAHGDGSFDVVVVHGDGSCDVVAVHGDGSCDVMIHGRVCVCMCV